MSEDAPHLLRYLPPIPRDRTWGDGYDWIGLVADTPWAVVPSWGRDGWDMGSWPYIIAATCTVVIEEEDRPVREPAVCLHCRQPVRLLDLQVWASHHHGPDCPSTEGDHRPVRHSRAYGVATYCESDIEVYAYAQHEDRIARLDEFAAFYWRLRQSDGPDGVPPVGPLLAEHSGPFSWERAGFTTARST